MDKPIAYDGDKPFIFISYSHRDSDKVWPVINQMNKHGYRVWYDDGIDPGTEWDEFIATKISECDYFIGFMSANYLASDNCKDELNYARDQVENRLLVYLEDVSLPKGMEMRLGRIQAILKYQFKTDNEFFNKFYLSKNLQSFRDEVVVKRTNPEERKRFVAGTGAIFDEPVNVTEPEVKDIPKVVEPPKDVPSVEIKTEVPEVNEENDIKVDSEIKPIPEVKPVPTIKAAPVAKSAPAVKAAPAKPSKKAKNSLEPVAMPIVINDEVVVEEEEPASKGMPKINFKKPDFVKKPVTEEVKEDIKEEVKEDIKDSETINENNETVEESKPEMVKEEKPEVKNENSDIPNSSWGRWGLPGLNGKFPKWFKLAALGIYVVLLLIIINRILDLADHLNYWEYSDIPGDIFMIIASIIVAMLALDYGWYQEKLFAITPSKKKVGTIIFGTILIILMIICFVI